MRLKYHPRFEYFDPLEGEIPEPYGLDYFEIVQRARNLLKNRTSEQINQAALIINQLYRDPDFVDPQYQEFKQKTVKVRIDGEEIEAYITSNDTEALHKNRKNILLAKYPKFPNAQWYELFAVITLSYVETVCIELQSRKNHANLPPDHWHKEVMGEQISKYDVREDLIFANQALTYAETLNDQEDQESIGKYYISEQNRRAGNKKHQPSNKLKAIVWTHYQERYSHFDSSSDAARRILKDLTELKIVVVVHEENNDLLKFEGSIVSRAMYPEQLFAKWIRTAKKAKS